MRQNKGSDKDEAEREESDENVVMGARGWTFFKKGILSHGHKCHLEVTPLEAGSGIELTTRLDFQCYCESFLNPLISMYLRWEIKKRCSESYSPVDFQNRGLCCNWVFVLFCV